MPINLVMEISGWKLKIIDSLMDASQKISWWTTISGNLLFYLQTNVIE